MVLPDVPRLNAMFPIAPKLSVNGEPHMIVPHSVRETMLMRRLGVPIPNPMLRYYDWRGGDPFDVQRKTVDMLTTETRAYVLNSFGTGKTKAALWAWDWIYSRGCAGKLLVVAPLSTLKFTWGRECFATLPNRRYVVLHGSRAKRLEKLGEDADIYIINHDGIKTISAELLARTDIDTLVIDELAVYRNESTRSKHMRKFAERFNWVWGMTGAPMPNEPTDVWAQAKIITPAKVTKFRGHARQQLMTKVDTYLWKPKPDATEQAFKMLQPSVRFSLDDVTELPEMVERTVDVELSADQAKAYKKMSTTFVHMIDDKTITAVNAAAAMSKLLQIAGGWVYTENPAFITLDNEERLETLVDLVQESNNKVLIFVPFRHAVEGIGAFLAKKGIDHCVVHGDTKNRDDIFNQFQNTPDFKTLAAHPQCMAHGITLTAADTIIWYLPTTSLEIYEQANARIRRVGQKNKQLTLHMQSTPVEKKLYALLRRKQKVQNMLLEMLEHATEDRNGLA